MTRKVPQGQLKHLRRTFLRLAFSLIAANLLLVVSSASQTPSPAEPIRISVDRVNVGVVVTDSHGKFVEGLHREDFHVFDNGVEQPLTDFAAVDEPAQIVLLIESGPAVLFLGENHARAAEVLLKEIAPNDRVAIVTYSQDPQLIQDFSTKSDAWNALQGLNFLSGFGELNLSASLGKIIDWLAPLRQKKTIVLLSTGVDTSSSANWQEIHNKLEISDIRVLAVSLSSDFRQPAKDKKLSPQARSDRTFVKQVFAEADQSLREISQLTGGRSYFPQNAKQFDQAYAEIGQLIRHEYSLAFAPASHDGGIHSIRVEARHAGYRVDHRRAYLAPH